MYISHLHHLATSTTRLSVESLIPFIHRSRNKKRKGPRGTGRTQQEINEDMAVGERGLKNKEIKRSVQLEHDWVSFNFVTGGVVMQSFMRKERRNMFLSRASPASKNHPLSTNYRVAQGLTTMKTSPVVLPHCVPTRVHPRRACGGPPCTSWTCSPTRWGSRGIAKRRNLVELSNKGVSNERPCGAHAGRRNKEIDQPCQTPRQTNSDFQVVC